MSAFQIEQQMRPTSYRAEEMILLVQDLMQRRFSDTKLSVKRTTKLLGKEENYTFVTFSTSLGAVFMSFPNKYNFENPVQILTHGENASAAENFGLLAFRLRGINQSRRSKTDMLSTPELRFETACKVIIKLLGI